MSLVATVFEVLADLSVPSGEEVKRELPNEERIRRIWRLTRSTIGGTFLPRNIYDWLVSSADGLQYRPSHMKPAIRC